MPQDARAAAGSHTRPACSHHLHMPHARPVPLYAALCHHHHVAACVCRPTPLSLSVCAARALSACACVDHGWFASLHPPRPAGTLAPRCMHAWCSSARAHRSMHSGRSHDEHVGITPLPVDTFYPIIMRPQLLANRFSFALLPLQRDSAHVACRMSHVADRHAHSLAVRIRAYGMAVSAWARGVGAWVHRCMAMPFRAVRAQPLGLCSARHGHLLSSRFASRLRWRVRHQQCNLQCRRHAWLSLSCFSANAVNMRVHASGLLGGARHATGPHTG